MIRQGCDRVQDVHDHFFSVDLVKKFGYRRPHPRPPTPRHDAYIEIIEIIEIGWGHYINIFIYLYIMFYDVFNKIFFHCLLKKIHGAESSQESTDLYLHHTDQGKITHPSSG